MTRTTSPQVRAQRLASRQCGAISRKQALGLGLTPDQIKRLVHSRRWRCHRQPGRPGVGTAEASGREVLELLAHPLQSDIGAPKRA